MGNCQAIDAAALVIQHPTGKIERMYWPISASEVMRLNPGHYVSLIIPLPLSSSSDDQDHHQAHQEQVVEHQDHNKTVRFTRVKLLRPNETLALGHAYRLVTTQEVMNVLRAKKYAKTKKQQLETLEKLQAGAKQRSSGCEEEDGKSDQNNTNHATKSVRHRSRTMTSSSNAAAAAAAAALRSKSWRPSLQSISEGLS